MAVKNPELLPLFEQVKTLLEPYAKHFSVRHDEPGYYDLWSEREMVAAGRRRTEMQFAALIVQKAFVGFYFMPIYADQDMLEVFGTQLLALLKGKSCFHLTSLTPELRHQIEDALAKGFALYEERGWV